jgi:soluble lytic murein transglycosylase-like protein
MFFKMLFKKNLRKSTKIILLLFFCTFGIQQSQAGAQKEEHLAFSVRTALSQALIINEPPKPEKFLATEHRAWYQLWRQRVSERLAKKIPNEAYRLELIDMIFYEARRAELEPTLVLGLIQVESNFRKYAISPVGARGFMQVMPFWVKYIGDGNISSLFNTQTNLRYGCVILRQYLAMEKQNHFLALGRYNGSRGKSPYPNAVLGAANSWYEWVKDVPR